MKMELLLLWALCTGWGIGCEPSQCEASCASYRNSCGTERSYDCSWVCEEADTPRTDRGCAECWGCLEVNECVELTLYETEPPPACWDECKAGCFERLADA